MKEVYAENFKNEIRDFAAEILVFFDDKNIKCNFNIDPFGGIY